MNVAGIRPYIFGNAGEEGDDVMFGLSFDFFDSIYGKVGFALDGARDFLGILPMVASASQAWTSTLSHV